MGVVDIVSVKGDNPHASSAAEKVNMIIEVIKYSGKRPKPNSILYLGREQRYALRQIAHGDLAEIINDKFYGWPIVWVYKESYLHLAS